MTAGGSSPSAVWPILVETLGFVGPANGRIDLLQMSFAFLLASGAGKILYLGSEEEAREARNAWTRSQAGWQGDAADFRAAIEEAAKMKSAQRLREAVEKKRAQERWEAICVVPVEPQRLVETFESRIVLATSDKSRLDEDDVTNASVIVYGKSDSRDLRQFGPRAFYTPGPLEKDCIAVLETDPSGVLALAEFTASGTPTMRTLLQGRSSRVMVSV